MKRPSLMILLFVSSALFLLQGCLLGLPVDGAQTVPPNTVEVDANDTGSQTGELRLQWNSLDVCNDDSDHLQIKIRRKKEGKWVLSRQEKANCSEGKWSVLSLAEGQIQVDVRDASDITAPPLLQQTATITAGKVISLSF
jgi:hypothetical protein